jgi:hypothetical protein
VNAKQLADQYVEIDHPYFDKPSEPLVHVGGRQASEPGLQLDWRQVLGGGLVAVGVVMLIAGWIGISGTKDTYQQLSYFLSGGLGGAAAVIMGATVLVTFEHYTDRQAIKQIDERLAALDMRIAVEFASLNERPARLNGPLDGLSGAASNGKSNGRTAATSAARRRA